MYVVKLQIVSVLMNQDSRASFRDVVVMLLVVLVPRALLLLVLCTVRYYTVGSVPCR